MLYLGLLAGVVSGNVAAHAAGIDAFRTYVATCVLIVPGLIGARLLYVALHWRFYRENPQRIWDRTDGGAAQYGGLALILPLSLPLLRGLRLPLGAFWDIGMISILTGMIFARFGCLLNGCCAGRASESWLSVNLPNHRGVWRRRTPTQCLEAAWGGILLVSAVAVWRWLPFPGALFLGATAAYACGRLVLESLREQEPRAGRFTAYHGLSVALIISSVATLAARWPK